MFRSSWIQCSENALNRTLYCLHLPSTKIAGVTIPGSGLRLLQFSSMMGHLFFLVPHDHALIILPYTLMLTTSLIEIQISDTGEMVLSVKHLAHEQGDLSAEP